MKHSSGTATRPYVRGPHFRGPHFRYFTIAITIAFVLTALIAIGAAVLMNTLDKL